MFLIGGSMSLGLTVCQRKIPKYLLLNFKEVNTCENEKRRQSVPILKLYLERFDNQCRRSSLIEKEGYSATGVENNFCLFDTSQI